MSGTPPRVFVTTHHPVDARIEEAANPLFQLLFGVELHRGYWKGLLMHASKHFPLQEMAAQDRLVQGDGFLKTHPPLLLKSPVDIPIRECRKQVGKIIKDSPTPIPKFQFRPLRQILHIWGSRIAPINRVAISSE